MLQSRGCAVLSNIPSHDNRLSHLRVLVGDSNDGIGFVEESNDGIFEGYMLQMGMVYTVKLEYR